MSTFPEIIDSTDVLDDVITRPSKDLIEFVGRMSGRLVVLGAGGKMGPSLCVLAQRAVVSSDSDLKVIGVSRFSDASARAWLEDRGVETIACDLMDPDQVAKLPDAENVIFLAGWKFGTSGSPGRTWAINTVVPSMSALRYPDARMVALSSGNVYPFVPVDCGGADETYEPAPIGEYAWSVLGRERVFQYWSEANASPTVLMRLNYAADLRYGVLVDLAATILEGKPVDLTTGYLNCIWQGDANDLIIRSLDLAETPAKPLNLTGPGTFSVRFLAERLAELMGTDVSFTGREADTALLNDAGLIHSLLGTPAVGIDRLLKWTAYWVKQGLTLLDKPTHFEVRDGSF
jgi:hypothetical protein